MLVPKDFTEKLKSQGFQFFTGVPDSLLKDLCAYITDNFDAGNHVITANEGAAVALATGYHLATGKAGVVYMQNSGTGNAVNPLLSLADPEVYSIPMLILIGWRGEPGVKDEPQHVKQGRVQEALMRAMEYPCEILSDDPAEAEQQVSRLTKIMTEKSTPVVLLVRKGVFDKYELDQASTQAYSLGREDALRVILDTADPEDRIVSTTGMASREIYELRDAKGEDHSKDFLTVGSMGHTLMIAFGLARFQKRRVLCVDGDGSVLMHMGSLAVAAQQKVDNLIHIVINNGAHDSVGGQPTVGYAMPFSRLAKDLGYEHCYTAETENEIRSCLRELSQRSGMGFLEIRVNTGARKDLGRPKSAPVENKTALMENL